MKKFLTIAAAALLCLSASAQQSIKDVIAVIRGNGCVSCTYEYTVNGGFPMTGKGSALLSGNSYFTTENGLENYSDGITAWTVDRNAMEVVISDGSNSLLSRIEDVISSIHIDKFDGKTLICTVKNEEQGLDIDFNAADIASGPAPEDRSCFSFDVSELGKDWIITDLR